MSNLYTALSVSVEEDLLPLVALLQQRGLPHRIVEENGQQVVKVAEQRQVEPVQQLYRAWRAGEIKIELAPHSRRAPVRRNESVARQQAPATLALIVLSVLGFLLVYLNAPIDWLALFTFMPFTLHDGQLLFDEMGGQYWRLVTPAFLHFGWLHIVFNSLWMWELGSRVERVMGAINMLGLFLVISLVSNSAQFLFGGPGLFGGMSGVVYGLLGFCWVGAKLQPRWPIEPAPAIMLFMIGWLLVCLLGVIEVLGFGAIANAAHVGGLIAGSLLGGAFALVSRLGSDSN